MVAAWPQRVAGFVLLASGSGCQQVAGLHDLVYATCESATLPTAGAGRIRLVNAGTRGAAADFCIRVTGTANWGQPVLRSPNGLPDCPSGLPYGQATVAFAVPEGSIDVEAITPGTNCATAATSALDGIQVDGTSVVTVIRMGGGTLDEQVVALPEEPTSQIAELQNDQIRVVNALSGGAAINLGVASESSLPATISSFIYPSSIAPGRVEAPCTTIVGVVDDRGYLAAPGLTTFSLGAAFQTNPGAALFVFGTSSASDERTVFAIGDPSDTRHPVQGLVCLDTAQQGGGADQLPVDAGSASPTSLPPQLLATCALTDLPSLLVDTLNVALDNASAPFEAQRRQDVYQAIAARPSDLMCLADTGSQADKLGIAAAAATRFPYSYFPDPPTNLDTQPSDPDLADGETPSATTVPACSGVPQTLVDSLFGCAVSNCCTTPGNANGHIVDSPNCVTQYCGNTILLGFFEPGATDPAYDRCFDCAVFYTLSYVPYATGEEACLTDPRQQFSFEGQTSNMILSHYPLSHQQTYVLPGSGYRHAILYAVADIGGQQVDFYCGQLISPVLGSEVPYEGAYGPLGLGTDGWESEQDLQATRAIAFIKAQSASSGHPAIIAGDWHSSIRAEDGTGTMLVSDLSPEVLRALDHAYGGAFDRAEPPGFTELCNWCPAPTNVYNGAQPPEDISPTFLLGFPSNATTLDTQWGTENVVPLTSTSDQTAPQGGVGPLSPYFGRLVRVTRPPQE